MPDPTDAQIRYLDRWLQLFTEGLLLYTQMVEDGRDPTPKEDAVLDVLIGEISAVVRARRPKIGE